MESSWIRGPFGLDAGSRVTRAGCHVVLVVVPTTTAGTRLLDVVPMLEADHRVQVVFTVPRSHDAWHDVEQFVRAVHGFLIPWSQAVQHRFDLVLAASHRHLHELHGPIFLMPHGAGVLQSRLFSRKANGATIATTGVDRDLITYRGRVLPALLALTHLDELPHVRHACPEALPAAAVVGDICFDRMLAGLQFRQQYRAALGVADGQTLITVSSTWSADSAFGAHPTLLASLARALPAPEFALALVLHPNAWTVHGRRQILAWLGPCLDSGLRLIPPEEGWRATLIASDWVIGDHGSTTTYAAAIGRPVTLAAMPERNLRPGSLADLLRRGAAPLDLTASLPRQFHDAVARSADLATAVAAAVTSVPGRAGPLHRDALYALLGIDQPSHPAPLSPVPLPKTLGRPA